MGVNFKDIITKHPISIDELKGKKLIVDGNNTLYQFLSTIRARDGSLLTDSHGNVTSHLIGLFSRTTKLITKGLNLCFVFDGKVPELKHKELKKRKAAKLAAQEKYEAALEAEDVEQMKKYGARTSRLTRDMIQQAKNLLAALGIPVIQAPSEGEAQAAHMVKNGDGWAVVSQDYDSLIYGSPRVVQNLSIEGRRKLPGKYAYRAVEPVLIDLQENLAALGLTHEQLLWLSVLVGTDYAPGGVKGIGPKKGLALVKNAKTAKEVFQGRELDDVNWQDVLNVFQTMPVTNDYELTWKPIDRNAVTKLLVEQHDFSQERVDKTLDTIAPEKNQTGLGEFL